MASVLGAVIEATLPELTSGVGVALPVLHALTLQGTPLAGPVLEAASLGGVTQALPTLSANEIIRQVRAMGLPVQRQRALQAIRAIREQATKFTELANLPGWMRPLESQIPLAGKRQRLKYQYTVHITGRDSLTGELRTQFISINSSRLITKNNAMALASETVLGRETYQMSDIVAATVPLITKVNPIFGS